MVIGLIPAIFKYGNLDLKFDGSNLPSSQSITLFEPFNLDLRIKSISITCIKGKVTKKVTAISPKCPAGYKKK